MKSLLLDIDGVLIRDKLLLEHVKDNCVQYVRTKLPECKDPRQVNSILYKTYGHTAHGLMRGFQIDASDFNEKVYDNNLLDHLARVLYSEPFRTEAETIHKFTEEGWNVTLFTNSPAQWAIPVARAISDRVYVVYSDLETGFKPEAKVYSQFSKEYTHVFVDDTLLNLATARWLQNWVPVHFNETGKQNGLFPVVSSIQDLENWISKFPDGNFGRSDARFSKTHRRQ